VVRSLKKPCGTSKLTIKNVFSEPQVGPRQTAAQLETFGSFKGASVVRGQDWSWDSQDGGLGAVGRVLSRADWNGQTARSVVNVLWPNKGENMYRMGHKVWFS
jgi:hypothetical protein